MAYSGIRESAATLRKCRVEKFSFFLLNQIDLALTLFAVSSGLSELNPWMRSLLHSPLELIVFKIVVPLFIAWVTPGRLLIPAVVLLAFVVGWDLKELARFYAF